MKFSYILPGLVVARDVHHRRFKQKSACKFVVNIHIKPKPVVEEPGLQTEVDLGRRFPGKAFICKRRCHLPYSGVSAVRIAGIRKLCIRPVGRDIGIAHLSETGPEFESADQSLILHELLLIHIPSCGPGEECTPLVCHKIGTSVPADSQRCRIAAVIGIVGTSHKGDESCLPLA